ncbi:MAG TPA: polymer-forming cytoskeletal protein [Longimicrobiaceae bacterium]|nr:polymer-forming cytoskeletal protein [Longimicrobiaceae bacterium]
MRTDILKVPALLLGAALLAADGAPLAAQSTAGDEVRREAAEARREATREAARAHREAAQESARAQREAAREMARARAEAARAGVSVLTGDHVVAKGETVDGDMVVVGGDLRVEGEVRGNAVVTGGDLVMEEGGTVLGDAVVTGGELIDNGGSILGEMRTVGVDGHIPALQAPPRPPRAPEHAARFGGSWFEPIGRGIAGVFSTLALGLVLAGIGAGLVFYGLPYLRKVSDTVRSSPGRSAAVGLAASFLIVPAFVLLVVALAVSIIGIPLLLVAVPLYPVMVVAAFGFGLLAVAHLIGEYTAEQRGGFDFSYRNAYAYVFFGVGLLLAPLLAAHMIGMIGFLGWAGALLKVVGGMILWVAATLGVGAVILTRAGTRENYFARGYDPVLDEDPVFDAEPAAREPHV